MGRRGWLGKRGRKRDLGKERKKSKNKESVKKKFWRRRKRRKEKDRGIDTRGRRRGPKRIVRKKVPRTKLWTGTALSRLRFLHLIRKSSRARSLKLNRLIQNRMILQKERRKTRDEERQLRREK